LLNKWIDLLILMWYDDFVSASN